MAFTATNYNPSYRFEEASPVRLPFYTGTAANTALAGQSQAQTQTGVPVNVGDLCFVSGPTRTVTDGATTNTSTTVTSASALFTIGDIGATITGTGIPANAVITAINSSTSVVISAAATATGSSLSLVITPAQAPSVFPAMYFPWTTNLATSQANFVKCFAGVSGQAFDGTNTTAYGIQDGMLRVDTSGVFDLQTSSSTVPGTGDLIGVAQDPGGNFLAGQLAAVVNGSGVANAIGRAVQPVIGGSTPAGTSYYASIVGTVRVRLFAAAMGLANAGTI